MQFIPMFKWANMHKPNRKVSWVSNQAISQSVKEKAYRTHQEPLHLKITNNIWLMQSCLVKTFILGTGIKTKYYMHTCMVELSVVCICVEAWNLQSPIKPHKETHKGEIYVVWWCAMYTEKEKQLPLSTLSWSTLLPPTLLGLGFTSCIIYITSPKPSTINKIHDSKT